MDFEEQTQYFAPMFVNFNLLHNFIDYEDIESPIKTIQGQSKWLSIIPGKTQIYEYTL